MATVAQLTAGIVADARAVGTSAAFNQTGKIASVARKGFGVGGILTEHVIGVGTQTGTTYDFAESGPERFSPVSAAAPSYGSGGGGGVSVAGDVNIFISGATDPSATALAVRDQLLILKRRGAIGTVFP